MTGFKDFFDTKVAEHNAELEAQKAERDKAAKEKQSRIDEITKPFRLNYEAVSKAASEELSSRGVKIDERSDATMDDITGYIYTKFFKISAPNKNGGVSSSDLHGFRINDQSLIEGVAKRLVRGTYKSEVIFSKKVDQHGQVDIQQVIHSAIEDVAKKL